MTGVQTCALPIWLSEVEAAEPDDMLDRAAALADERYVVGENAESDGDTDDG